jgi:hypothetical protein
LIIRGSQFRYLIITNVNMDDGDGREEGEMTELMLETTDFQPAVPKKISWFDEDAQCILVWSQPHLDADLWSEYGRGAARSYRRHGVETALDIDALNTGADTAMFLCAVDSSGTVVAGVRAKGPLQSAEDSHAVVEWEGQPSKAAVHKMITDRLAFGILEMKSAWVEDDKERGQLLTHALARSGSHLMAMLDIQFCMATAAAYVLNRWRSSGGVVAPIPATPYPDKRYQTKMMWWDRQTYARHAEPGQLATMRAETQIIASNTHSSLSRPRQAAR